MDTAAPTAALTDLLSASIAASKLPPVIDAEQCAALLRCSKPHIDGLADRGDLPATKFGRGWVFVTAQLLAHVAAACQRNLARSQPSMSEFPPGAARHQDACAPARPSLPKTDVTDC